MVVRLLILTLCRSHYKPQAAKQYMPRYTMMPCNNTCLKISTNIHKQKHTHIHIYYINLYGHKLVDRKIMKSTINRFRFRLMRFRFESNYIAHIYIYRIVCRSHFAIEHFYDLMLCLLANIAYIHKKFLKKQIFFFFFFSLNERSEKVEHLTTGMNNRRNVINYSSLSVAFK